MRNYILSFACLGCWVATGSAQPSGMEVLSGSADLTTQPHLLQVQASDRAIIQWDSFSIGAQETTRFLLPDAASAVLNRVSGAQMSELMGVLQSNGQVFLINPQGVFVGPDATIDTASFIASTFDVLNEDFLAKADLLFQGDSSASIINLGTISTQMGDVVLLARHVDNQGSIIAPNGTAALGAGTKVLLKPAGSERIYIETSVATDAKDGIGVHNQGSIQALLVELQADGNPYQHAICHDGRIDALGVREQNGRILLVADEGQVYITGQSKATAAEHIAPDAECSAYGEMIVCADDIIAIDQATFDVSNASGGGFIRLGLERKEGAPRARGLWTGKEVQFNADATLQGNGGRVLLWGEEAHIFLGNVSAQGGPLAGDGGFVDISTRGLLIPEGLVSTFAINGKTGTLLYDPTDITITTNADSNLIVTSTPSAINYMASNPSIVSNINIVALQANLALNNVSITTASTGGFAGNITLGDSTGAMAMPITWASANTLTLFANQDILIFNQVQATGSGAINFTASRDFQFEAITVASGGMGAALTTVNGGITLLAGRNIVMQTPNNGNNLIQTSGSGNILVTAADTAVGYISINGSTTAGFGSFIQTTTAGAGGNITIICAGGGALPSGFTGALELIAGNTATANQSAAIAASTNGTLTITTGWPTDAISGASANGGVTLSPGGMSTGQNAQITTQNGALTFNLLNGNLRINGGSSTNAIFGRIAKTGATAANMSVFIDGLITIFSTSGSQVDLTTSPAPFGVYSLASSAFKLTVSQNVSTTTVLGAILIGSQGTTGTTTISILGNLTMAAASSGAALIANLYNLMSGPNGMTLNVGGAVLLTTAGGTSVTGLEAYTKIGALGTNPLNMTVGGNLTLTNTTPAGTGTNVGETEILSSSTGGANIIVNGSIAISGSTTTAQPSGIGRSHISSSAGPLVVTTGGDIVMTGGAWQAGAHIGYPYAAGTMGSPFNVPITVNTQNLIMNAGAGVTAGINTTLCLIGHGLQTTTAEFNTSPITVNATGTVNILAGTSATFPALAMIGNIGATGATLGGNIIINAMSVDMLVPQATSVLNSFSQIGHGSVAGQAPTFNNFTITVVANRSILMHSNAAGALNQGISQIQNLSAQPLNTITLVCDNASATAPDYGTGYFFFQPGSQINAGPGDTGQVLIYSSVRIFNTVTPGAITATPINGSSPVGFTTGTLGTNTTNEIWGTYYNPAVAVPYTANFVVYYKRVGGILVSNFTTSAGVTVGSSTTFPSGNPEVYINVADISTVLTSPGNVTINAETLSNLAPTNNVLNGNSVLWRQGTGGAGANLTWASAQTLTVTAGNDITVRDANIVNTEPSTSLNVINFLAGRDCVIGTGDQDVFSSILQATGTNKTITVITGRDLVNKGGCININFVAEILNSTTTSTTNLTVGRDLILQANESQVFLTCDLLTATIGRNCIQNAGNNMGNIAGSLAIIQMQNNSSISIGGYHSLNGGSGTVVSQAASALFLWNPGNSIARLLTYQCTGGLYLTGGSGTQVSNNGAFAMFQIQNGLAGSIANLNITNGNVILNGGAGGGAFIWKEAPSTVALSLNVPNGSLILQGNQLGCLNATGSVFPYGSAMIFGDSAAAGASTNITVGGDIRLIGGNGPNTFAAIGNPLDGFIEPVTINVAGNLIQQAGGTAVITSGLGTGAGTGFQAVAQIVTHGNSPLTINVGGDYLATGGPGVGLTTVGSGAGGIAAGITNQSGTLTSQLLTLTVGGDMVFTGGARMNSAAGCIWGFTGGASSNAILLTVGNQAAQTGDLILRGGTGYGPSAFLSSGSAGIQNVTCFGNLSLTSNASSPGFGSVAFTGPSPSGFLLNIGRNVTLSANGNNPAYIGSGGLSGSGTVSFECTITLNCGGDLTLNGSSLMGVRPVAGTAFPLPDFSRGFAQIGHINASGVTTIIALGNPITITSGGSIIQNGGNNPGGYAQIGHGGYAEAGPTTYTSPIVMLMQAGRNIIMNTPATTLTVPSPGPAQIINYATGAGSSIELVTDNLYLTSPNSGPGSFQMSNGSLILTSQTATPNPNTPVKIYTSVRLFNTLGSATINETTVPALQPLGINGTFEQWGVYASGGTYTARQGFKLYYKRIGGLLISSSPTEGASIANGVYTFSVPEAIINGGDLGGNLSVANVSIDTTGMSAAPLGSSANSVVITSPIGWGSANTLSINSSQDLILNNMMTSTSTGFPTSSSGITLSAARNIFIGDGTESAQTGMTVSSAPINVTAGGSIGLYGLFGGTLGNGASVLLENTGNSGDITMTASTGGMTFQGGGVTGAGVIVAQNIGNLTLNVLSGDLNIRGGTGASSGSELINFNTGNALVTVSTGNMFLVGGSGSSAFSAINYFGPFNNNVTVSVLQGNLILQSGIGTNTTVEYNNSAGALNVNVPVGNLTIKGNVGGFASCSSFTGEVICNVGENILLKAGIGGGASLGNSGILPGGVPITVTAGGSITLTAQNNNLAVIGSTSSTVGATIAGDITVTACAGITLQGEISGQQFDTLGYAKIGHYTSKTGQTLTGNITVTAGDAITLLAGSFNGQELPGTIPPSRAVTPPVPFVPTASAAQIGLGNDTTTPVTTSGSTTINARALTVQAGLGAQGGSASVFATGSLPLTLNISAGDLYIQSGGSPGASATASAVNGTITATISNGNILLLAGVGNGASATTPNIVALTNTSGIITASCAGSLTMTGGLSGNSNATLGTIGGTQGALTVSVGTDVVMTSGFGANSYATIGCNQTSGSSALTLTAGGNILLTATGHGYVNIGDGSTIATTSTWSSPISVTAGGNIVLSGTGGSNLGTVGGVQIAEAGFGFAQIGHINSQSSATAISGNITVTAGGSVILNPGLKSTAYARIGHGGITKLPLAPADTYTTGSIQVLCGENLYLLNSGNSILDAASNTVNTNIWGQLAQVINLCSGPIWLVVDQDFPTMPDSGTGHFVYSSNGWIASVPPSGPAQPVKIYSAVQVFNSLAIGSLINNQTYLKGITTLPPTLPQAHLDEEWGYSFATDATNPFIGPNFTIYYKRIGGLLLSGDLTSGASLSGSAYTFNAAEPIINTTTAFANDLLTALAGNTTVNATTLPNTSDPNNSILFRHSWTSLLSLANDPSTLTWGNPTQLTLIAPQDINISATANSTSATSGIILVATRDVLLETAGLSGQLGVAGTSPITITAGRDYVSMGPFLGFTIGGQVSAVGSNPVTITAGRDVAMLGGPFVGTTAQYAATGGNSDSIAVSGAGNIVVTAGRNMLYLGGYGSGSGLSTNGAITMTAGGNITMQGGSGALHSFVNIAASGPIAITAGGNIAMLGGFGLANGPSDVDVLIDDFSGGVAMIAGGSITMAASPSISSQSPGVFIETSNTDTLPITIITGGDLMMTAGPGGGEAAIQSSLSLIDLTIGGNLTLISANLPLAILLQDPALGITQGVAHIGADPTVLSATPTIIIENVGGNLALFGNRNTFATIGGASINAEQNYTGDITIKNVIGSVILNGYSGSCNNDFGFAQIGVPNNRIGTPSTITSNITIATQGDITLTGGSTPTAYALIGNGGQSGTLGAISGNVVLFSAQGNLTLNSNVANAIIQAFDNGSITTIINGNTTLNGTSSITSVFGPITLLTGVSQILNGSSTISNQSPEGISIVADNLYPTPPKFGLGRILTGANSSISTPGPLRLYSVAQQLNIVSGLLNNQHFVPGPLNINSAIEQWFKYYPQFFGGFPFTFFYKTSLQGMILEATVANSTLTQYLPLVVPIIRVWEVSEGDVPEDQLHFQSESEKKSGERG